MRTLIFANIGKFRPLICGLAAFMLVNGHVLKNASAQLQVAPALGENVAQSSAEPDINWKIYAADNALAAGMTLFAEDLYRKIAALPNADDALKNQAQIGIANCLLERDKFAEAEKIFAQFPNDTAAQIRLAIALVSQKKMDTAGAILEKMATQNLSENDTAWFHVARALLGIARANDTDENGLARARAEFSEAQKKLSDAKFRHQNEHMKMLEYLAFLRLGNARNDTVAALEDRIKNAAPETDVFKTTLQLAMALDQVKRAGEGVERLEKLTSLSPAQRDERDLLLGVILLRDPDKNTEENRAKTFYRVLENNAATDLQFIALNMLGKLANDTVAAQRDGHANAIVNALNDIAAKNPNLKTLARLHLVRAKIELNIGAFEKAEMAAQDALKVAPDTQDKIEALRICATAARENPSRKDTARTADYIAQLAEVSGEPEVAKLAGDYYYLNGDFEKAAGNYARAFEKMTLPAKRGEALLYRVKCLLLLGKIADAEGAIAAGKNAVDAVNLKKCEWETLNFQRKNDTAAALANAEKRIAETAANDTEFQLRFRWQKTLILFGEGKFSEAIASANDILARLEKLPNDASVALKKNADAMRSHVILLRARAELSGDKNMRIAAKNDFEILRKNFPTEPATAASYLVEGRDLAAQNMPEAAGVILRVPFEMYEKDTARLGSFREFAAIGLYESAEQKVRFGDIENGTDAYEKANEDFEILEKKFPENNLKNKARLRRAEIFQKQAKFDEANQIYETLYRELPDNAERFYVEFARADYYLAKAAKNTGGIQNADNEGLKTAIEFYNKIFIDTKKTADQRAEAGFKIGKAYSFLKTNGTAHTNDAREKYWLVATTLLNDNDTAGKLTIGKYWISRCIFEGAILEKDNSEAQKKYTFLIEKNLPGKNEAERLRAALTNENQTSVPPQ